jgi:hypothetical protein
MTDQEAQEAPDDPVAGAAAEVVEAMPADAVPADDAADAQHGKNKPHQYPSPMKYQGHKWAARINRILDRLDASQPGEVWHKPAETVMVGECAMATGEAFGLDSKDSKQVPIHPGWLLLFAVLAFAAIIAAQRLMGKTPEPANPAREAGLRDLQ